MEAKGFRGRRAEGLGFQRAWEGQQSRVDCILAGTVGINSTAVIFLKGKEKKEKLHTEYFAAILLSECPKGWGDK